MTVSTNFEMAASTHPSDGPSAHPPTADRYTNGSAPSAHPTTIQAILQPVQAELGQVEQKMKMVDSSVFAPLARAFVDLIGSGGKRLRPALALTAAQLGESTFTPAQWERVRSIAAAVEMLHTATLVHDDVIDEALLRRGAPTLNALWSKGATVLAGNYMFAQAASFAAETENMRVINIFSDTLHIIVNGELRQIFARYNYEQKRDEYYERIYAKTASLFSAATESAAVIALLPEPRIQQLKAYGYNLGMAFQIVDDILDFTGDEETLGKPAGSDLRQGTLTLPFFYFLQAHPHADQVVNQFKTARAQTTGEDDPRWDATVTNVVQQVRTSSAIDAARREADEFLQRARENLVDLPDNVYRQSLLALCDFVVQRTY